MQIKPITIALSLLIWPEVRHIHWSLELSFLMYELIDSQLESESSWSKHGRKRSHDLPRALRSRSCITPRQMSSSKQAECVSGLEQIGDIWYPLLRQIWLEIETDRRSAVKEGTPLSRWSGGSNYQCVRHLGKITVARTEDRRESIIKTTVYSNQSQVCSRRLEEFVILAAGGCAQAEAAVAFVTWQIPACYTQTI